jgi:disease resistance protein RPM1
MSRYTERFDESPALPGWITSLKYISKLVLQYSNLKSDPPKALQKLPSLVMLELRQAYKGEELRCDPSGFSVTF